MKKHILAASALALLATSPSVAFEPQEREEIETIVREYLLREPELLVEVLDALEEQRSAQAGEMQREAIAAVGAELTASPEGTVLGNPEGDVTIVEFFDYNCGFCRRAQADMEALIEDDPELRVVLKEIPVLGPESEAASRVSLAIRDLEPERYAEFQRRLLTSGATANEEAALALAEEMGLDRGAIAEATDSPAVVSALQESARLAAALNITGTPTYVVGNELVPGAVGADQLASRIAQVRECGEAGC